MGKDKSEKKDKKEKKEKKRAETDGVHKHKKDKKEKKLSDVAEKELTAQVLEGLEKAEKTVVAEEIVVEVSEKPIGALVPFANPLAEDKTAKKVFKTVKKGMFLFFIFFTVFSPVVSILKRVNANISNQPLSTNLSSEESKKSSKLSAKVPHQQRTHPLLSLLESLFLPQISLLWTSSATFLYFVKITAFLMSLSRRAPSLVLPEPQKGPRV